MSDDVNIRPTRLYKMKTGLSNEIRGICLASGIKEGEILWCHSNRPSSLGGYLGTFSHTYTQMNGYSPCRDIIMNMPMYYFEPVE